MRGFLAFCDFDLRRRLLSPGDVPVELFFDFRGLRSVAAERKMDWEGETDLGVGNESICCG